MTVFETATRNSVKTAGFDHVGEFREGWKADIVDIDTNRMRATSLYGVLSHFVFVAHGNDMVFTMADGDVLCDEDEYVCADADGI